jgi:ATP/maltotriose-dependent transcriptional regulator MalT
MVMMTALGESLHDEEASVTPLRRRVIAANNSAPAASIETWTVKRESISEAIGQLPEARLVLLTAAAGFGKTTAMRQHRERLERAGRRTVWMVLSAADDDLVRFRARIFEAASRLGGPKIGKDVDATNSAAFLAELIAQAATPTALFLDGFEAVKNTGSLELLQQLLALLPGSCQIVLAARQTPKLQLGRLRARGHLVEIDEAQLRFSLQETQGFMQGQRRLNLGSEDVTKLHEMSGGWPAILWLAVYELKQRPAGRDFLAKFSASSPGIAEFLAEEVLSEQPHDVREFLLKCSILQELDEATCNALCQIQHSADILTCLSSSQVFLAALDSGKPGFHFRPMVASFLRRELQRRDPKDVARLHLIAARWFEAQGRLARAVEHALASGDTDYSIAVLNACAEGMLCQGRSRLLARWFQAIPRAALRLHYELRVTEIWALTTLRRSADALLRLEELCRDAPELSPEVDVKAELGVVRSCILAIIDRAAEGDWLVKEDLKKLPTRDSIVHRIMVTTLASWKVASNQFADAIRLAQMFRYKKSPVTGASSTGYYSAYIEGLTALAQCHIREAIAHFRVALADSTPAFKSVIAVHLAEALYEVDELQEAVDLLAEHAPAVRDYGRSDHLIISHILQARLAALGGDTDSAFLRLSELESIARHEHLPRALASSLLERARMALCVGDTEEAQSHLDRAREPSAWSGLQGMVTAANDVETVDMCRYRLQICGYGKADMTPSLSADIKIAHASQRHRRMLRLNLLLSKALYLSGQQRLALRTLEGVLRIARQEGMLRAFLDEGAPIVELLRAYRVAKQAAPDLGQDAPLVAFADRILKRAGVDVDLGNKRAASNGAPTLTARELQTLDALASGLSNQKIAERLFVSETTVRSHLRKISAKLGTSSRTQAVCVARNFGLI